MDAIFESVKISEEDKKKLSLLGNDKVNKVISKAIKLMTPAEVLIFNDSKEDLARIRQMSIDMGEEIPLTTKGHTVHFDGYVSNSEHDLARDKKHTATLLPSSAPEIKNKNQIERKKGLKEIKSYLRGCMKGAKMIVRFFCLGPNQSVFSMLALQITDSSYVAHSEDILYRPGYTDFLNLKDKTKFFYLFHSAGELNSNGNTKNLDKRRIYIDPLKNRVYSVNNQYAGNSLGLKKLCLRLAIYLSNHSDWLTEHMFISGFSSIYKKDRMTYFAGAFPSACGKTSTAMIPGSSIIGDDIAYLRDIDGEMRGVNIECGCFGIIRDVNQKDDPYIYELLTSPRELIFSNILVEQGIPYWAGMGKELPKKGRNFSGIWKEGNVDKNGSKIVPSHPNARFTLRISELKNADMKLNDPKGVRIDGLLYGGRDSDTSVPVCQSLSWEHGVFIGATIESETTAATIGKTGVRTFSPMANFDFLIVPLGLYLKNHIKFGNKLKKCPKVFATNYFIKDEQKKKYLNAKTDKKVWILWAEGRIHNEKSCTAIKTPVGFIPTYESLKGLFKKVFDKEFTKEEYVQQFSIRAERYLEKFRRIEDRFKEEVDIPKPFYDVLEQQKTDVKKLIESKGKKVISPFEL